jgi:hypothetical protein
MNSHKMTTYYSKLQIMKKMKTCAQAKAKIKR